MSLQAYRSRIAFLVAPRNESVSFDASEVWQKRLIMESLQLWMLPLVVAVYVQAKWKKWDTLEGAMLVHLPWEVA